MSWDVGSGWLKCNAVKRFVIFQLFFEITTDIGHFEQFLFFFVVIFNIMLLHIMVQKALMFENQLNLYERLKSEFSYGSLLFFLCPEQIFKKYYCVNSLSIPQFLLIIFIVNGVMGN